MVEEGIIQNISDIGIRDFVSNLPPELASPLGTLILILQAVGVFFAIYLIFLIVMGVLNIKRGIKINKIFNIVEGMDKKLDKVLKLNKKEKNKK